MIGYYVHHDGSGPLHRASALAAALDGPVTGLSSSRRPADWPGPWIDLDPDGLPSRMTEIASWVRHVSPEVLVVDVSVEVALLTRLLGVPVIYVVPPGRRRDVAHTLAFDVADALVGLWPQQAEGVLGDQMASDVRVQALGGLSRFPVSGLPRTREPGPMRATLLLAADATTLDQDQVRLMHEQAPEWDWTVIGGSRAWTDDPRPLIEAADVVVCHAGQNTVAEVAAARRPAVILPQPRPYDEQECTARALDRGPWPVIVERTFPLTDWDERLALAAKLDGADWATWCDGHAAERFAAVVDQVSSRASRSLMIGQAPRDQFEMTV